jgi:hypothetical protein
MTESKKTSRKRSITTADNEIGQERFKLYKSAFDWISKSIDNGYNLEAISVAESLISDRLESYLSFLKGEDFSFKNLGSLIDAFRSKESKADEVLRSLVIERLDPWRKRRNIAAHEMVKIEDGKNTSWEDRVKINHEVAREGLDLVRKIDNQVRKARSKHSLSSHAIQPTDEGI